MRRNYYTVVSTINGDIYRLKEKLLLSDAEKRVKAGKKIIQQMKPTSTITFKVVKYVEEV